LIITDYQEKHQECQKAQAWQWASEERPGQASNQEGWLQSSSCSEVIVVVGLIFWLRDSPIFGPGLYFTFHVSAETVFFVATGQRFLVQFALAMNRCMGVDLTVFFRGFDEPGFTSSLCWILCSAPVVLF